MATYSKHTEDGMVFLKGELGEPCSDCNWIHEYLCDFPVGNDKTCDRLMCEEHAMRISDDIHYCHTHYLMWVNYVEGKGIEKVLPAKIFNEE